MSSENINFWDMSLGYMFSQIVDEAHEVSGLDPKKSDVFVVADKVFNELRAGTQSD